MIVEQCIHYDTSKIQGFTAELVIRDKAANARA